MQGVGVVNEAPANGQVLKYNGAEWVPAADNNAGGTVTSVNTGNGLTGGPIVNAGTIDLRLNAAGGLSKTLGAAMNELGIPANGIVPSMVSAGNYGIDITGNAATVTNGVYTT